MTGQPSVGIVADQVEMVFHAQAGPVQALNRVSFRAEPGEFICLVGPSGCGKSTLLRIVGGLLAPSGGAVTFAGVAPGARPRSGFVFQEHALFPWMTLGENVAFGLEAMGMRKADRLRRSGEMLDRIGLGEFTDSYPHQLSGGMRQRAAIARALLVDPQMLLLDEPFSALDAQTKLVLQEELLGIWESRRQTVLYVTHDIREAVLLADTVLIMSGRPGRIREVLPVPRSGPRDLSRKLYGQASATTEEMTWHIWKVIEDEVRQSLRVIQ